jgi:hypothetical protein
MMEHQIPCQASACKDPAIHIVTGYINYKEKVNRMKPLKGFRWEDRSEGFMLFLCRDHRNKWIRRGSELALGGSLI